MINRIIISLLFLLSIGFSQWFNEWSRNPFLTPNAEKIILTDGFYYKEFSGIKYTGPVIELLVGSTSSKKSIYVGEMVDGEKDGKWTRWNTNGRKKVRTIIRMGGLMVKAYIIGTMVQFYLLVSGKRVDK